VEVVIVMSSVTSLIFVIPALYPDDQGAQRGKFECLFEKYHEWRPVPAPDVCRDRGCSAAIYAVGVNYLQTAFVKAVLAETWTAGTTMWRQHENDEFPTVTVLGNISVSAVTAPNAF
jgi:hypothetical protein